MHKNSSSHSWRYKQLDVICFKFRKVNNQYSNARVAVIELLYTAIFNTYLRESHTCGIRIMCHKQRFELKCN